MKILKESKEKREEILNMRKLILIVKIGLEDRNNITNSMICLNQDKFLEDNHINLIKVKEKI